MLQCSFNICISYVVIFILCLYTLVLMVRACRNMKICLRYPYPKSLTVTPCCSLQKTTGLLLFARDLGERTCYRFAPGFRVFVFLFIFFLSLLCVMCSAATVLIISVLSGDACGKSQQACILMLLKIKLVSAEEATVRRRGLLSSHRRSRCRR